MNISITTTITNRWEKWAKKRNRPGNTQTLNLHNIYILPSGFGLAYSFIVLITFIGAINSQINTIFFMAFILTMIAMSSAFEAHGNLKNISFKLIEIKDAQQGTPAKIILFIDTNRKVRFGVKFKISKQEEILLQRIPSEGLQLVLPLETNARGYFSLPPIIVSSLFPFGIFRVFSYVYFEEHYYVYPQPADPGYWPTPLMEHNIKHKYTAGEEDFYDLQQVENPWTQPNLISWKIAAKGQGWYLKKMDSNAFEYWLFKLSDLSSENMELKLQQLSYWLQQAEQNGLIYALDIKTPITFSRGKMHLQNCLRKLAIYS